MNRPGTRQLVSQSEEEEAGCDGRCRRKSVEDAVRMHSTATN